MVPDHKIPLLLGDARRLKQVLINLVRNAIKFTTRGTISIRVLYEEETVEQGTLLVSVQDTGVGIASEDLATLFTRFGKLQRTAQLNNDGIGLGLTIVKQIVELTGGSVQAQSEGLGCGSTFSFLMPFKQIQMSEENASDMDIYTDLDVE